MELKSGGEEDEDQMVIEPPEVRKAPYTIMNQGRAYLLFFRTKHVFSPTAVFSGFLQCHPNQFKLQEHC